MKRNAIIICVFIFLSVLLITPGCTCHGGEFWGDMRGFGYMCADCWQGEEGCRYSCLANFCVDRKIYEDYYNSVAVAGIEGVDYCNARVEYTGGASPKALFSVEILRVYNKPWKLEYELCFIQDGNLLYSSKVTETVKEDGIFSFEQIFPLGTSAIFNEFYKEDGGEVECIINHVALKREE